MNMHMKNNVNKSVSKVKYGLDTENKENIRKFVEKEKNSIRIHKRISNNHVTNNSDQGNVI